MIGPIGTNPLNLQDSSEGLKDYELSFRTIKQILTKFESEINRKISPFVNRHIKNLDKYLFESAPPSLPEYLEKPFMIFREIQYLSEFVKSLPVINPKIKSTWIRRTIFGCGVLLFINQSLVILDRYKIISITTLKVAAIAAPFLSFVPIGFIPLAGVTILAVLPLILSVVLKTLSLILTLHKQQQQKGKVRKIETKKQILSAKSSGELEALLQQKLKKYNEKIAEYEKQLKPLDEFISTAENIQTVKEKKQSKLDNLEEEKQKFSELREKTDVSLAKFDTEIDLCKRHLEQIEQMEKIINEKTNDPQYKKIIKKIKIYSQKQAVINLNQADLFKDYKINNYIKKIKNKELAIAQFKFAFTSSILDLTSSMLSFIAAFACVNPVFLPYVLVTLDIGSFLMVCKQLFNKIQYHYLERKQEIIVKATLKVEAWKKFGDQQVFKKTNKLEQKISLYCAGLRKLEMNHPRLPQTMHLSTTEFIIKINKYHKKLQKINNSTKQIIIENKIEKWSKRVHGIYFPSPLQFIRLFLKK